LLLFSDRQPIRQPRFAAASHEFVHVQNATELVRVAGLADHLKPDRTSTLAMPSRSA
jgi:hypothetical protein